MPKDAAQGAHDVVNNHDASGRRSYWPAEATIVIIITVWAYLVETTYLRTYLAYFSADLDWFQPSLLGIFSFGYVSLILAAFFAALYYILVFAQSLRPLIWWALWVAWAVITIGIQLLVVVARVVDIIWNPIGPIVWGIVIAVGYLLGPVVVRLYHRTKVRRLVRAEEAVDLVKRAQSAQEKGQLTEEMEHEANRAQKLIDLVIADAERPFRQWVWRHRAQVIALCFMVGYFGFAESFGTIHALFDSLGIVRWRSALAEAPNESAEILFTDGTRSLIQTWDGNRSHVTYINKQGDVELILYSRAEARLRKFQDERNRAEERLAEIQQRFLDSHIGSTHEEPATLDESDETHKDIDARHDGG